MCSKAIKWLIIIVRKEIYKVICKKGIKVKLIHFYKWLKEKNIKSIIEISI